MNNTNSVSVFSWRAQSKESIGEAIRRWFALDAHRDVERIEIEITFDKQSRFILVPTEVHWRKKSPKQILPSTKEPLSFHPHFQSELWKRQIDQERQTNPDAMAWTVSQFKRFVQHYGQPKVKMPRQQNLWENSLGSGSFPKL